jgi:hypothetical protein
MKNSAYRSMQLAKENKTKNKDGNLRKWIDEKWLNLNALADKGIEIPCGKKYKGQTEPTVCRPKKKVDKTTPKPLANSLSKAQIKKAIKIKKEGKRIEWKKI